MLDIILKGGKVVDGSGLPARKADVGILDGKIAIVQDLGEAEARETLDVSGLHICPGFIDMHSHSDLSLMAHRKGESSLSQGITTEVIGSCGWSMAPVKEETKNSVLKGLLSGLVHKEAFDTLDWSWHSFGEWMTALEKGGLGVNVAPQVGQSLIRAHVVGTEKRDAAPGEIEAMKALVRQAMEDGAWGLSTGRSYRPGGFAPTEEVVELAKVVGQYGGIYATHMKSEGDEIFDAVDEVIHIAERAGVRAEISHHKAVGRKNFGKVNRTLEMIEKARQRGLSITVDVYPYEFSQSSSLVRMLPAVACEELKGKAFEGEFPTTEEIRALLADRSLFEKVRSLPAVVEAAPRLKSFFIVRAPSSPDAQGRVVEDLVAETGRSPVDIVLDLVAADGLDVWAASCISMEDVHTVIKTGFAMGGTDGFNLDHTIENAIHPRHYGTFPRIVGRFVRNDRLFSLEEAVRKVTRNPALAMGIPDRGLVEAGYWADLVVFDQEKLMDTATGTEPYNRAEGIEYVLVNGKIALDRGVVKPAFAGQVLRRR
ncbi:MAG: N-acyl-D-amino-acid deacylase family protein [Bacillota bacterium]